MVNSKQKGSKWECEILKVCREIEPDSYRSVGSGGVVYDKGDLIFGQYMIEAKHHKDLTDSQIENFFLKVEKEAEARGKIALLVFKINRRKPKVMFRLSDSRYCFMYWEQFLSREGEKREKARHQ